MEYQAKDGSICTPILPCELPKRQQKTTAKYQTNKPSIEWTTFWVRTFSGLSEEGNMADNAEIFHSFQMQCLIDKSRSSFTAFKIKTFADLYGQFNKVFKSTMGLLLGNIFYNSRR